jgi:hypothetical protein
MYDEFDEMERKGNYNIQRESLNFDISSLDLMLTLIMKMLNGISTAIITCVIMIVSVCVCVCVYIYIYIYVYIYIYIYIYIYVIIVSFLNFLEYIYIIFRVHELCIQLLFFWW